MISHQGTIHRMLFLMLNIIIKKNAKKLPGHQIPTATYPDNLDNASFAWVKYLSSYDHINTYYCIAFNYLYNITPRLCVC